MHPIAVVQAEAAAVVISVGCTISFWIKNDFTALLPCFFSSLSFVALWRFTLLFSFFSIVRCIKWRQARITIHSGVTIALCKYPYLLMKMSRPAHGVTDAAWKRYTHERVIMDLGMLSECIFLKYVWMKNSIKTTIKTRLLVVLLQPRCIVHRQLNGRRHHRHRISITTQKTTLKIILWMYMTIHLIFDFGTMTMKKNHRKTGIKQATWTVSCGKGRQRRRAGEVQ